MPSYAVESRRTPSYAADGARRYVTVPGVGGDLQRKMEPHPVTATPPKIYNFNPTLRYTGIVAS